MTQFLQTASGRKIAYNQTDGNGPGIVFLGGFMSDMGGTKATYLENWAKRKGRAYVRFDYSGHGESEGAFTDGCIGDWAEDAMAVLSELTNGPQILVGSSMGGYIATLVAKSMPDRVAGLVGIAAAPDFTEKSFWAGFSEDQRAEVMEQGVTHVPSDYGDPYPITKRMIEDGRKHQVLDAPLTLDMPVRLLIARGDAVVSVETQMALLDHVQSPDVRCTIVKGGDHSFSQPDDLKLIATTIHSVTMSLERPVAEADEVLWFWFDEISKEQKFKKDLAFDQLIKDRFGDRVDAALAGGLTEWEDHPLSRLALIILLDQFTRNIYRGDPKCFSGDSRALALSKRCVEEGDLDAAKDAAHRIFALMPMMHSEDIAVQDASTPLYEKYTDENTLKYAHLHRDIIEKWGRYPHRNEVLGRESTPEELEFLQQPGSSF